LKIAECPLSLSVIRGAALLGQSGHAERVLANLKTENLRRLFRSARAAQGVTDKTVQRNGLRQMKCCHVANVRSSRPAQPIDAIQALNLSAGVSNFNVSRGRSLS
jgi:hypothetical protein